MMNSIPKEGAVASFDEKDLPIRGKEALERIELKLFS